MPPRVVRQTLGLRGDTGAGRPATGSWLVLETGVVLAKVALVTVGWLAVFLLAFVGYLTLPAIVLGLFLLLYGTLDVIRIRRRRAARHAAEIEA